MAGSQGLSNETSRDAPWCGPGRFAAGLQYSALPWLCSKTSEVWVVATAGFEDR